MLHVVVGVSGVSIHGNVLELGPVVVTHRVWIAGGRVTKVVEPVLVFQVAGDCRWVGRGD